MLLFGLRFNVCTFLYLQLKARLPSGAYFKRIEKKSTTNKLAQPNPFVSVVEGYFKIRLFFYNFISNLCSKRKPETLLSLLLFFN